jgi:hypothetical protein
MQYPIPPYPEYHPIQPKRSAWQRFRSLGCAKQSLFGCLSLIIVFGAILCAIGTPAFVQGWQVVSATETATVARVVVTPSTQASIRPRMGGPLDDFVATYGQPTATAPDSETFLSTDKLVRITAYVTAGTTIVDRVYVTGPSTWNATDDYAFCLQLLPDDAQEFQRNVGPINWLDYHSSMGEIVMQLQVPTCLLFVSPPS